MLELLYHRTADETGGAQRALENFSQFLLKLDVHRGKVQEWNRIFGVHSCSPMATVALVSTNLLTRAGFPATMALAGTTSVPTRPAPTIAFSPIVTLQRTGTPEPPASRLLTNAHTTSHSATCRH